MLILFLAKLCLSAKYAEFRFWENYGQILFDRSLNNRHARNGMSLSKDDRDCLYTDRGFYLPKNISVIQLPVNDFIQKIEHIPTPYQVVLWFFYAPGSGRLTHRYSPKSFWVFYIENSDLRIYFKNSVA